MRLIDADAALLIIEEIQQNKDIPKNYGTLLDIARSIRRLPTIDAEPTVHAHWILEKKYADGYADYKCSNCEFDDTFHIGLPEHFYKRCPHCGAKMDEEEQE